MYDRLFGGFPAKNTVCTPCIYGPGQPYSATGRYSSATGRYSSATGRHSSATGRYSSAQVGTRVHTNSSATGRYSSA